MFELSGPWLAGGLALAYLVGAFTIRYIKDVLKGVPSPLRTALNAAEKTALARLKAAEQAAVNEAVGILPAPPPAPATATAPAASATSSAASEVKTIADKALADIQAALAKVGAAPAASSVATDVKTVGDEAAAKIKAAAGTAASDVKTAVAEVAAKV